MNWIKGMQDSIDYIEKNLSDTIDMNEVAARACCSTFYYQRMFMLLTDMTVSQYIRNRRMTMAAEALTKANQKVLDVALVYGYESSEAFSRAFKKHHGFNPSEMGKTEQNIQAFPKLVIQIQLKGVNPMEYRIEKKEAFKFYGMKRRFTTVDGENFLKIPKFWDEVLQNGTFMEMLEGAEGPYSLGVCMPMKPEVDTEFDYVIGAFGESQVDAYETYEVPASEWAVFPVVGPIHPTLQDAWKRIYSEWFPTTNYQHAHLPEVEVYSDGDPQSQDYLTEIWIPIIH